MATGRTISASFLTERDARVIELCRTISKEIADCIDDLNARKKFVNDFGKTSDTRDGGMGVGAGKLQRDALCTRGRQGKAPFSNRNLRWHPLVVAESHSNWAQPISRIEIENDELLVFVIKENGRTKKIPCRQSTRNATALRGSARVLGAAYQCAQELERYALDTKFLCHSDP